MNIVDCSEKELKRVSKIHKESWKWAYKGIISNDYLDNIKDDLWVNHFKKLLTEENIEIKILNDKKDLGVISYIESKDIKYKNYIEIISLYMFPESTRRGYGKILLDYIEREKRGIDGIYLWVLKENINARSFYEKNGFINSLKTVEIKLDNKVFENYRYIKKL